MSERVDKNIMNAGEPSDEEWLEFIQRDDDEQLMIDSDSLRLIVGEEINEQVEVIDIVDEQENEVMEINVEEQFEDAKDKRALLNLRMQKLELKIKAYKKKFINKRGLNQQESTSQLEHANNSAEDRVIQNRREKRKCDKRALLANCWTCFCWIEEGDIIWRCERRHVICNLCKSKMNNSCSCGNPVNERDTKWENLIKNWDK